MIIAVIEYSTDAGEEPLVFVATDVSAARRMAAEAIAWHIGRYDINDIGPDWLAANPVPDMGDAGAVEAWLDAFKAETTDLWLTLYSADGRDTDGTKFNTSRRMEADTEEVA